MYPLAQGVQLIRASGRGPWMNPEFYHAFKEKIEQMEEEE
jgi:hypothetical protein